jgi:hypothetical protein
MTGVIATLPKFQFSNALGLPMSGGTLTSYLAGTTTPATTYQDQALNTANTNPISLDSRGECTLWLDSTKTYKFVLKNSAGVIQWTVDNVINAQALVDQLRTDLAAPTGSSLVGYMPAGVGAVGRTLQDKVRESVSVKDFGAVGDGSDETVWVQATLTTGAKVVDLCGLTLSCNTLTLATNQKLINGQINLRTAGTTLLLLASGCALDYVTLVGSGNTAEQLSEILVRVGTGTIGAVSSVVEKISITNCTLKNSNGYAGRFAYTDDVFIHGNTVVNVRYAGFLFISAANARVIGNRIDGVTGLASNKNAYGVTFTSDSLVAVADGGTVSRACAASGNVISNVQTWNGLDTHGGTNIVFSGNTITGCAFPIGVVSTNKPGALTVPATRVSVTGNTLDCTGVTLDANRLYGIAIAGEVTGSVSGVTVTGNTLIRCGIPGNNISGAIYMTYTIGCVVHGNTVIEPFVNGISIYTSNSGFSIGGNSVVDAFDNSVTVPSGIIVRDSLNSGVISGNTLRKTGASVGTYTAVRGIDVSTGLNNLIQFGINYSDCTTPFRGLGSISTDIVLTELTDATGGAANATVQSVGNTTIDQSVTLNNNFADILVKMAQMTRILRRLGVVL